MKDMGHLPWVKSVVEQGQAIAKCIYILYNPTSPCTNEIASGWGAAKAKCDVPAMHYIA